MRSIYAMDSRVSESTDRLMESIRQTDDFTAYISAKQALEKLPGVIGRLMELRQETTALYGNPDEEAVFSGLDALEGSYEELLRIPEVNAFLEAEAAMLRLFRGIQRKVAVMVEGFLPAEG